MQAFEVTGTVDEEGQLAVDYPFPIPHPGRVRMIVLMEAPSYPTTYYHPRSLQTELVPLPSFRNDPDIQDTWDGLAQIFVEEPDEDWNQLLLTAQRKSRHF